MIPLILVGVAAFAAGVIVSKFLKQIVAFLQKAYYYLPERYKRLFQGAVKLVRKVGKTLVNVIKQYTYDKEEDQWREHIVEKKVDASDVPDHIRNKLKSANEIDISDETAEQLKELKLSN